MICIFVILLTGWCRTRMRPARLVSNAFLYTTDDTMLKEFGLSDDFIEKIYNDCKQIMESDMDQYFNHIKNLEESILENKYLYHIIIKTYIH